MYGTLAVTCDGSKYDGDSYTYCMSKETNLQKLGRNIAKYRHKKGISQDELAFQAGLGERTISRIELGERDPRFTTLEKIAKTLGIELKNLMEFDK